MIIHEFITGLNLPMPRLFPGVLSAELFLKELSERDILSIDDNEIAMLRRLIRKGEVGRKIRAAYSFDLSKPATEQPMNEVYISLLLALGLGIVRYRMDWVLMNGLLKLSDPKFCSIDYQCPAALTADIQKTLYDRNLHAPC